MDLESEQKTSKKKKHKSSDSDDSSSESSNSDEKSNKKVKALQKDMLQMMKEFKNLKKNPDIVKGELWCTDCKDGHTKGSCPKKQFCDICQVAGHSLKECPFNLKTKGHQQVLLTQEASNNSNNAGNDATSGGYRNNNRRGRAGNNNNNNGGRGRIQYDASRQPMIQCRACNLWGHFARDCTTKEVPQLLCRWCGPGDHEDSKCPKQSVNLLSIEASNETQCPYKSKFPYKNIEK